MNANEIENIADRLRKIGIETYIEMSGQRPVLHSLPAPVSF